MWLLFLVQGHLLGHDRLVLSIVMHSPSSPFRVSDQFYLLTLFLVGLILSIHIFSWKKNKITSMKITICWISSWIHTFKPCYISTCNTIFSNTKHVKDVRIIFHPKFEGDECPNSRFLSTYEVISNSAHAYALSILCLPFSFFQQ